MCDFHNGLDAPTYVKVPDDFEESRVERSDEVAGDAIRDGLMEGSLVTVGPQIELERLELDALRIGRVADADRGEVRLARHGAEAGELRRLERDLVVALGVGIGKGLEVSGWVGGDLL